jgi:hypothetical protein
MKLLEFFYFNDNSDGMSNDRRYDAKRDSSVLTKSDTRKIKLTLRQLNQLRLSTEAHEAEKQAEAGFISQMYSKPVDAQQ